MVVGFNHNFRYKGSLYHVQTEDGGLKNPHIVTLLFSGGTILSSRKTSYADIVKVNNLDQVVEELMKEQHREMLRQLKDGDFDALIRERLGPGGPPAPPSAGESATLQKPKPVPAPAAKPAVEPKPATAPRAPASPGREQAPELNLDDIILSYLTGDPGRKP